MILAPSRLRIGTAQQFWASLESRESCYVKMDHWTKGQEYPWMPSSIQTKSHQIHVLLVKPEEVSDSFQEAYKEVQYRDKLELWLIRPFVKTAPCGCDTRFRIRCEEHGGPYSDLRRAAAFFANRQDLEDFDYKHGLFDMNAAIIDTNHPDTGLISELSFAMTMIHPPGWDNWYRRSCQKLVDDPESRLDPLPELPETWDLSWKSLIHEWRPSSDYDYCAVAGEIARRFKHVGISLEIKPANPENRPRPDTRLPYTIWCLKNNRTGLLEWLDEVKKQTDLTTWKQLETYVPGERPTHF